MKKVFSVIVLLGLMSGPVFGALILAPGDAVVAVDPDAPRSGSSYPGDSTHAGGNEQPFRVLDNDSGTKYLNYAGAFTGFIVTPSGAATVQSFTITTANDAEGRDPSSWRLYGTNDAISSADNSTGLAENWSLIGSDSVSLPSSRFTTGPVVPVSNSTAYSSYRMLYPTLKGDPLMQIADVAFYASNDGSGSNILGASDPILAIQDRPDSEHPGHEGSGNVVDATLGKYLNFGKENSGFIVTPAFGSSIVHNFEITTANDSEERDPTSWELYGTNDAILSTDDSTGDAENWMFIDAGPVALPSERDTLGPLVTIANGMGNSMAYASYKILFPTLKDTDLANSMQIAEIQFYGVPEPATVCLLGLGGLSLLRRRKR